MRYHALLSVGLTAAMLITDAHAQVAVTDPATTLRNAVTAAGKELLLDAQSQQHSQLRRMAQRLSLFTDLRKYALPDAPRWRIHDFEDPELFLFSRGYHAALNYGDATGGEFLRVARARQSLAGELSGRSPAIRDTLSRSLGTLDVADSTLMLGTDTTGRLRYNGRQELRAIEALERHVVDPSQEQSTTAVLDKISGAVLIGSRQRQARLQFLMALVEQLLVDNTRARNAEAIAINMQLERLRTHEARRDWLAGASDDLRAWRQP